jgi:hypothetical protein
LGVQEFGSSGVQTIVLELRNQGAQTIDLKFRRIRVQMLI